MRRQLMLMAYHRPQYFGPVVQHWTAVRGLDDWTPLVSLDPSPRQAQMTAIADEAGLPVIVNHHRYGVLHHPWAALERAFTTNQADFAVIAEDDVLVAEDILEFFTWAADYFAARHILAVSASSYDGPGTADTQHDVITRSNFSPMCWGTWADRWRNVLRDTWDHNYSSGTSDQPQSGWDWNINLRIMADWRIAAPLVSRTDHIGRVDGAHTTSESFPGSRSPGFTPHLPPGTYRHTLDR